MLVVEDDPGVRRLATVVLSGAGYQVVAAEHPEAAIRLLERREEPVDLLLTDIVMPGMNGRDLAARVVARWPGVRVLFTSGYPGDAIRSTWAPPRWIHRQALLERRSAPRGADRADQSARDRQLPVNCGARFSRNAFAPSA